MTKILNFPAPGTIDTALEKLKSKGAVLLVPTETVYGLVCKWDDNQAVERIYKLKQRESRKPLTMFVNNLASLHHYGVKLPPRAEVLADKFCPGPLTLIIEHANRFGDTLGFRIPDHAFMLELLRLIDAPLASTSANLSGSPNALNVPEALNMLCTEVDLAVDAGPIAAGAMASTVVKVAPDGSVQILREGPVGRKNIFNCT